jgi:hypothetical protein
MDADAKINQLVDLMADLTPNVDKLMRMQERTNLEVSEVRKLNMRLADIIEKLTVSQEKQIKNDRNTFGQQQIN